MTATQSLTETNRAIVEKLYASLEARDQAGVAEVLAEDVVILEPAYLPFGGTYQGRDQLATLLPKLGQVLDVTSLRINYIIADGERVAAGLGLRDRASGEYVDLLEQSTVRDGKIVEMKLYYHDTQTLIDQPKIT